MMTDTTELSSFFDEVELDAHKFALYADGAHASFSARERFDTLVREYQEKAQQGRGDPLRAALGLLILGKFGDALEWFGRSPGGKLRHYYAAEAALGLNRFADAVHEFQQAARAGWDALECDMRVAAVHVRTGDLAKADELLRRREAEGVNRPDWHFVRGLIAEARDDRAAAGEAYEMALGLDPEHTQALFRCARLYDMCGDDEQALELYNRLSAQPRAYVNALLNAAGLYEERGAYDAALSCLRRVLKAYPNHRRARLYFKSVESCRQMVIEDAGSEPIDARTRLLATPLSEFELSVRARNCLKKMNIRTLGDLVRLSEAELLAYKNFGETSLSEINALLVKKGLRLGLQPEEVETEAVEDSAPPKALLPPGQEAALSRSVAELELSVRSRRCLHRLNVVTLGDLLQYSEADLLATRNFGVTSLSEIKTRLTGFGLQLAPRKMG